MALDPRIPLGVQPIQTQQPNMLGQYAQIMGIRAAQQDIQGNEDLRAAYAQGGDLNDPEFRRRVMAANPKLGSQLIKTNAETGKLQNEAIANRIKLSREMLTGVNTPEDYLAWHESNHKDPVLGGYLGQRGITAEQSRAKIMADLAKPGGLDKLKRESALGATELQKELMQTERSTKVAGIGAAATMRGQDMTDARMREQQAFEREKRSVIAGEGQFLQTDAYGNVYPVSQFGATRGPNAPAPAMPPAAANAFVTTQPPSVNALAPTAPPVVQPGSPTVANALAMDQQQNVPKPRQPIRQPVAIMGSDDKSILVDPKDAIGKRPATPFNESTSEKKAQLDRDLNTAIRNIEEITKPGGLLEKSTGSGFGRMIDASQGFFGKTNEGAIAAAQLAPVADMVLKMVPRFEGPQSNRDVDSYLAAAGKLADASLPNDVRAGAAKVILKLMKERKGQFETKGQDSGGGAPAGAPADPLGIR